jgi:hypothetical protein
MPLEAVLGAVQLVTAFGALLATLVGLLLVRQ